MRDFGEMIARLIEPISAENPCGRDMSDSDALANARMLYNEILAETRAAETQPSKTDEKWSRLLLLTSKILENESKDLQVLSYWGIAALRIHGLTGVRLGMDLLSVFLQDYFETVFPLDADARIRTIELFCDESIRLLGQTYGSDLASDGPIVESDLTHVSKTMRDLINKCQTIFPPDDRTHWPSSFETLLENVEAMVRRTASQSTPSPKIELYREPIDPDQQPSPSSADQNSRIDLSELAPLQGSDIDEEQITLTWQAISTASKSLSTKIRHKDPADPRSYRILRTCLFPLRDGILPIVETGREKVPILQGYQGINALQLPLSKLFESGQWSNLLDSAENSLSQFPFWLDGHWYVYESLKRLGTTYAESVLVVATCAREGLVRFPRWLDAYYSPKQRLAERSQDWARSLLGGIPGRPSNSADARPDSPEPVEVIEWPHDFGSTAVDATHEMDALVNFMRNAPGERARVRRRMAIVQYCYDTRRYEITLAQAGRVLRDLTACDSERWEPDLVAGILSVLVKVLSGVTGDEAITIRSSRLLSEVRQSLLAIDPRLSKLA